MRPFLRSVTAPTESFRLSPAVFAFAAIAIAAVAASIPRPVYAEHWEVIKRGFARYEPTVARPHFDASQSLRVHRSTVGNE